MHTLFYSGEFDNWFQHNSSFKKGKLAENFNDDLDQRINTYLFVNDVEEINSFILPISLNGNFYDFSGLIFAHHVRLTRNIKCCDVTIILYGTIELVELLRLTPLARILLTDNVLYLNTAENSFEEMRVSIKENPHKLEMQQFIKQIQIEPPSNYEGSHHSADNEFALIQWSKYIGCYNILPDDFKKEFDSRLYLKYLRTKNPVPEINTRDQISINTVTSVNILLIDDEADSGWKNFYSSLFSNSTNKINFEDSGIDFKDPNIRDIIISKVESKVIKFQPDLILLDLRLLDSDFDKKTSADELTGLKILEKIKEINKGIQVIITTASNKAWNFNLAKQKGAYDFIIKDGFENPVNAIKKLISTIEISAKRAKFLKKIDGKIGNIKELIKANNHFDDKDDENIIIQDKKNDKIRKKLFSNLDLAFELLDLSCEIPEKKKYFSYSYLQFFICIEEFGTLNVFEKNNPVLFVENDQLFISHIIFPICICKKIENKWQSKLSFISGKISLQQKPCIYPRKLDTNFYVSSILIYKYGNDNSSISKWTDVYMARNKVAHEGHIPNQKETNLLLNFMLYFFDKTKENDVNIKNGLIPITFEESLQKLMIKHKHR